MQRYKVLDKSLHFFFRLEEVIMKCGECQNMSWFGDYALHYCKKTGKVVEEDTECNLDELEDEVTEE